MGIPVTDSVRSEQSTRDQIGSLPRFLDLLRCPISETPVALSGNGGSLTSSDHSFLVTDDGIPIFAEAFASAEARQQQAHYDRIAEIYLTNLSYPHTIEYMKYLDRELLDVLGDGQLGAVAEICCGHGESFKLIGSNVGRGVGVDISLGMLRRARAEQAGSNLLFVQGDATRLPLASEAFDHVFMLGGIHHVNDRAGLFSEVCRILKPGGAFIYREPVSDFFLWRALRSVVYRLSPALDHVNERPLRYVETVPVLAQAGLQSVHWTTHGFLGFCFFMNSDVLIFNRAFQYVPGIGALTRFATDVDAWTLKLPGLGGAGLQVIGKATKGKT